MPCQLIALAPSSCSQDEGTPFRLETALELYNLQHVELLWQKEPTDTKCLLAWVRRNATAVGFDAITEPLAPVVCLFR